MQLYYTVAYRHLRPDLWIGQRIPPMLIAASACWTGNRLKARPFPPGVDTFCDSGGFVFASKNQEYPFTIDQYVEWVRVMRPGKAATLDYPCEPEIAKDPGAVRDRQYKTLFNAVALMSESDPIDRTWDWVPVIQGSTVKSYLDHAAAYEKHCLLRPLMGIGSLCHRTNVAEIDAIIRALTDALPQTKFHLFGVKMKVFSRKVGLPGSVVSADTGAWNGRFRTNIDVFNEAKNDLGLTQVETEVRWAQPRYEKKFNVGITRRKTSTFMTPNVLPDGDGNTLVAFACDGCGCIAGPELLEALDEEELAEFVTDYPDYCPVCHAPYFGNGLLMA